MGTGKSTLAKLLALNLELEPIDLDQYIEQKTGFSISETILNKGELFFRKLERDSLIELLEKDDIILSTGGGTPCYFDNIELLNNNSLSIFLMRSPKELFNRLVGHTRERPLLAHLSGEDLQEYIAKHVFERTPFYQKATLIINANNKTDEALVEEIKATVNG